MPRQPRRPQRPTPVRLPPAPLPGVRPAVRRPAPEGAGARRPQGAGPAAAKKDGELVIEADELWSFVGTKRVRWWVWVALDRESRQVVAMVAGDRSEYTAQCLWDALPDEYRAEAVVATDFLAAYRAVV